MIIENETPIVHRAERFEVVDREGRVRAVLGLLERAEPTGQIVGVELRDAAERARATLAVGEDGSWMLLELAGNARIVLGVNDPESDAVDARAFLYLCDTDGRPVAGWRVNDEGAAEPASGS